MNNQKGAYCKKNNTEGSMTETAEQFNLQGLLLSQFYYSRHFNKYYEILLQNQYKDSKYIAVT